METKLDQRVLTTEALHSGSANSIVAFQASIWRRLELTLSPKDLGFQSLGTPSGFG